MNARKLRWVLLASLILLAVFNVVGFSLLSNLLAGKARAADHALIDADIARSDTEHLQKLQKQLADSADIVTKAKQIVGSQTDYKYQDQVISDLNKLAQTYGIKISGYSFPATGTAPTSTTPTKPGGIKTVLPKGVKQVLVTINISGSVQYESYLKFLRSLELNLTRLQVTGVDLTPNPTAGSGYVTNPSISIQMYVRQ